MFQIGDEIIIRDENDTGDNCEYSITGPGSIGIILKKIDATGYDEDYDYDPGEGGPRYYINFSTVTGYDSGESNFLIAECWIKLLNEANVGPAQPNSRLIKKIKYLQEKRYEI